ncbi:hypothetical protein ACIBIZ_12705 [Nonomuraea spiralis]|uniref:hypothetical protein n=1 Tax=Nonomuraea spiralis TaxID=46182 RepID=UPI0037B28ED5
MSPTALRLSCVSLAALLLAAGCSASSPPPEQTVQPPQAWSGDSSADDTEDAGEDRVEVCVRKATRVRAADKHCENDRSGYGWYYLLLSRQIPAVGKKAAKGSFFSNENSAWFRARPRGGKGSKAIVEQEPPNVTDDDGGSTPSWNRRCTACARKSTGRRR